MRIVIVGAGNAGRSLAAKLCEERHDVVVIEHRAEAIEEIQAQLDIQTLEGDATSPRILREAGVDKANLMVAVSNRDEVNILSCLLARSAGVQHTVARVANADFINAPRPFSLHALGIDLLVSQQEECAREIFNILRLPGAVEAVDMLDGKVLAVGVKISMDSPLIMAALKDCPEQELLQRIRFIAVLRGDEEFIPRGDTQMMIGDAVYLVGQPADAAKFIAWACPENSPFDKIVVAGGGDLGLHLARLLEKSGANVVLLEREEARAEECARQLDTALVLKGDALDQETIDNAGIAGNTAVVAVTGSDENNIIICLMGEKAGATYTLAQVSKPEYVPIIDGLSLLDRAVSSHMSMINSILHFIRGKNVQAAAVLQKLPGELLEVALAPRHKWTNRRIRDLRVPEGVIIAAVSRSGDVLAATGDLVLLDGDQLVLFSLPEKVGEVEVLFRA